MAVSASPVIRRYKDIVNAFLGSERPMASNHARHIIAEQFKKHQLRIGKIGGQPTLTDRALEQIPLSWLQAQYPSIDNRSKGEFFNPIDNITLGSFDGHGCALALAVLFESSGEALKYWFGTIDRLSPAYEAQCDHGQDYWSNEALFKLDGECSGNCNSISEKLENNLSNTIFETNAAGLSALGQIDIGAAGQAILDFQEGMSIREACESNGASLDEVEKLLRDGITKFASAIKEITQPKIQKNAKPSKETLNKYPQKRESKQAHLIC